MRSAENIKYILERRSFQDFLNALGGKVDLKEYSEVGGMVKIIKALMSIYDFSNIIDVGCGKRPTLATYMAYNYSAPVFAIDPKVDTNLCLDTNSLYLFDMKLSEFINERYSFKYGTTLILCNHSHATKEEIEDLTNKMNNWVYLTMPCCIDNILNRPYVRFEDEHIWSPKNKIFLQDKNNSISTLSELQ